MVEALAWASHRRGSSKQGPVPRFRRLRNGGSEAKPEGHLHQTRLIELCRNLPECVIGSCCVSHVRLSKLNAIEEIERFCSKFQIEAFGDGRPLEYRKIVV